MQAPWPGDHSVRSWIGTGIVGAWMACLNILAGSIAVAATQRAGPELLGRGLVPAALAGIVSILSMALWPSGYGFAGPFLQTGLAAVLAAWTMLRLRAANHKRLLSHLRFAIVWRAVCVASAITFFAGFFVPTDGSFLFNARRGIYVDFGILGVFGLLVALSLALAVNPFHTSGLAFAARASPVILFGGLYSVGRAVSVAGGREQEDVAGWTALISLALCAASLLAISISISLADRTKPTPSLQD